MIDAYLAELSSELAAAGVRGRDARRLLEEARDHLEQASAEHGAEAALRSFGSARSLAGLVAAELATARTRVAAVGAFALLGVTGAFYAAMFLTLPSAGTIDAFDGRVPYLGPVALAGAVLFPQLAFVAGCLALLRAARLRRRGAQPAAELSVQRWRTGVALGAGALTVLSLGLVALSFGPELATWWVLAAATGAAVLAVPFLAVAGMVVGSTQPRAPTAGPAETVVDDLALLARLPWARRVVARGRPGRLALVTAAAAAVALAGVVAADPIDGALRALLEAGAVLGCYGLLGGRLGLR